MVPISSALAQEQHRGRDPHSKAPPLSTALRVHPHRSDTGDKAHTRQQPRRTGVTDAAVSACATSSRSGAPVDAPLEASLSCRREQPHRVDESNDPLGDAVPSIPTQRWRSARRLALRRRQSSAPPQEQRTGGARLDGGRRSHHGGSSLAQERLPRPARDHIGPTRAAGVLAVHHVYHGSSAPAQGRHRSRSPRSKATLLTTAP
jgi:hypothetical protein